MIHRGDQTRLAQDDAFQSAQMSSEMSVAKAIVSPSCRSRNVPAGTSQIQGLADGVLQEFLHERPPDAVAQQPSKRVVAIANQWRVEDAGGEAARWRSFTSTTFSRPPSSTCVVDKYSYSPESEEHGTEPDPE